VIKRILSLLSAAAVGFGLLLPLTATAQTADKPFNNEQLDQMLAQIALYPDSLLSQVLMAATYPDEFASAVAWSKAHPDAKGDAAVKMVENEPWDASVASLVAFPEALITLGDKPDYVRNLGDAFLAQPEDVMDSVQRLRQNAQKAGNLQTNEQVKVSTAAAPAPAATSTTVVVQQATPPPQVIVIEPARPSVVYVPAYNPAVVYGPWWYPAYPPYYYPPPPGYWWSRTIATGIAWGVGIGVSNALWGGFDWGRRDVNINVNRYNSINVNKRIDVNASRTSWNHDSGHRGKVPYKGGDATRQKLDKKRDVSNREQFRGKDPARDAGRDGGRDASRDKAAQAMQERGGSGGGKVAATAGAADRDAARQRAQDVDRGAAQQRVQDVDREAARQKAQKADSDAARQRAQQSSKDNALKGAGDRQAKQQVDRGAASQKAAQRPSAPAQRAPAGGGTKPAAAKSAAAAKAGGGGAKPGGAGAGGGRSR
jgi:hypothetical protein